MSSDARVDEFVQRWRQLLDQGQFVPAVELCAECPELIDAVERRIAELESVREQNDVNTVQATKIEDAQQRHIETAEVQNDPVETGKSEIYESLQTLDGVASNEEFSASPASSTGDSPTEDEIIFSVSQLNTFKFHAKGGLGEVYVAGDKDLHRQVAL